MAEITVRDIFSLAIEDIQRAADALLPVYEHLAQDGYVSLEVDPFLAHDTRQTIEQVQRLWDLVARPNLMVKIPPPWLVYRQLKPASLPVSMSMSL